MATMDREQAREYIVSHATDHLKRARVSGFVCPICGSGSKKNGTGITSVENKNRHFTCWAGCFKSADMIDIIGLEYGLTDYNSKLQKAAAVYGITIEGGYNREATQKDFAPKYQKQAETEQKEKPETDFTDFFLQAEKDINKTDYHRGLSSETLERFHVGYVESWKHPKAPRMTASPRLIVPTSQYSYIARYAGKGNYIDYRGKEQNKSKAGTTRIFNKEALYSSLQPVFVAEGEIDAMSFYEVGAEAVGLGSIANTKLLLSELKQKKPSQPLIIALDNEKEQEKRESVEKATGELAAGLKQLNIPYYIEEIYAQHKDANEALNADRAAFAAAVAGALDRVELAEAENLEVEREQLKRESVAYSLQSFIKDIEESKNGGFVPTGFSNLDSLLDGGLYQGLYVLGAISSLGKTTFCLQIADQIAQAGHDVLFFSLEMPRNELIARSISRLTLIGDLNQNKTTTHAKSTRGILSGKRYANYSKTEMELIAASVSAYSDYAGHIYITEGVGDVGAAEIKEKVQKHIRITGKAPVVIIDYIQLIAPADMRATDKQNTDKAVLELKRLSRDYGISVIGISSFNRESYTAPVKLSSFKESGSVEYCSDVLIGLQYAGMDYQENEKDKEREIRIRELIKTAEEAGQKGKSQKIQVKILKNRNGTKGSVFLDFYPMFNYFTQGAEREGANNETGWTASASSYTGR